MIIAFVRHGRTAWNRTRRLQGRSGIPLDECGRAQARAIAEALAQTAPWSRIVSSPLARARETAAIIASRTLPGVSAAGSSSLEADSRCDAGDRIDIDARLVERDYGVAEGLPVDEAYARWADHDFPESEPPAAVTIRALALLGEVRAADRPTIIVAHGTLIRLAATELTGTSCPRVCNGEALLIGEHGIGTGVRRLRPPKSQSPLSPTAPGASLTLP